MLWRKCIQTFRGRRRCVRGPEVGTIDLTGKTFTSKGGFITVAPNAVTGIASDAVLNEDGGLDFAKNDFTIASIVLVKK